MSFFTIAMYAGASVNFLVGNWVIGATMLAAAVLRNAADIRAEMKEAEEAAE